MLDYYPKRIVCMTEETTETLYLLGEQGRILGSLGLRFDRRGHAKKSQTSPPLLQPKSTRYLP
jgi:iron complex transport system substrate-binding protein